MIENDECKCPACQTSAAAGIPPRIASQCKCPICVDQKTTKPLLTKCVTPWCTNEPICDSEYCSHCRQNMGLASLTKNPAASPQPRPTGDGQVVLDKVLRDLQDRAATGHIKYGTKLRTHNGRNALLDAYQEALDLAMYLAQALMEQQDA